MNNLELLVNWIRATALRSIVAAIMASIILGAILGLGANLLT